MIQRPGLFFEAGMHEFQVQGPGMYPLMDTQGGFGIFCGSMQDDSIVAAIKEARALLADIDSLGI